MQKSHGQSDSNRLPFQKYSINSTIPVDNYLSFLFQRFSFLLDYATIVLPGVLVFTVLADSSVYVLLSSLCLCISLMLFALRRIPQPLSVLRQLLDLPCPGRLPFVTLYRTYVNLFTAIAILAVDFHIYPRRLAKAETYGSGLMDVGVGCFLLAHGLTAPEARHPEDFRSVPSLRSYLKTVRVTLRAVLRLFVLGLLRLMSVKSTNYQEHVTEYGVHWNFFFTIAVVRVRVVESQCLFSLERPNSSILLAKHSTASYTEWDPSIYRIILK